jgi:hypothetical protein
MASPFQSGLAQDTVFGARLQFIAQLPGHGHATGLGRMLELAVSSPCLDSPPAVRVQEVDDRTHLNGLRPLKRGRSLSDLHKRFDQIELLLASIAVCPGRQQDRTTPAAK